MRRRPNHVGSSNIIGRELHYLNLEPIWAVLRMPVPACPIAKDWADSRCPDTVHPEHSPQPEVPVNTVKTSAINICHAYSLAEFAYWSSSQAEDPVEETGSTLTTVYF